MPELKNTTKEVIESLGYEFPIDGPAIAVPLSTYRSMQQIRRVAGFLDRKALVITDGADLLADAARKEDAALAVKEAEGIVEAMKAAPASVAPPTPEEARREEIAVAIYQELRGMLFDLGISRKIGRKAMTEEEMRARLIEHHFPAPEPEPVPEPVLSTEKKPANPSPKGKGKTNKTKA